MCFESLINAIEEIPAGRLFRIKYSTEVELTKDAKEKGFKLIKTTETTTRTGVAYKNLKSTIEAMKTKLISNKPKRDNPWEYISENRIKYNKNTHLIYLCLANIRKGHNTKISYRLYNENKQYIDFTFDELNKFVNLVKKTDEEFKPYITVKLENIREINGLQLVDAL